jgi:hypothetical protein
MPATATPPTARAANILGFNACPIVKYSNPLNDTNAIARPPPRGTGALCELLLLGMSNMACRIASNRTQPVAIHAPAALRAKMTTARSILVKGPSEEFVVGYALKTGKDKMLATCDRKPFSSYENWALNAV